MRLRPLLVLAAGLLVAAGDPKDDPVRKDLEKLQGTWVLVSAERDGKKLPEAEVKKTKITIDKDRFTFPDASGIGTSKEGTFTIDPAKTPKWMDSTAADAAKGKVSLGVYEISGNDYRVCFAPPGKDRPTGFGSKPGTGHILQVWKRHKE